MPLETVPADAARRLLLAGQGLLADPARRATPSAVHRQIERMGFVQVDTINVVRRAHHHILGSRFDGYRSATLARLLERDRKLFEHWTHDASIIPLAWFPYWRVRFRRYRDRGHSPNSWWARRLQGEPEKVIAHVLRRVRREGPLRSRDFERRAEDESGPWWGWAPHKVALEYLWRTGELSVSGRDGFHKVYDLTERVFPAHHRLRAPSEDEHRDWACRTALERLGVATAGELASFLGAIGIADARRWCADALAAGAAVEVRVESANGEAPRRAVALPDWSRRASRCPPAPDRIRLLSPFDPVLRDRKRTLRLFGFDYRFEAFVPAPRRRYGYYVLPMLEGERLVGRLDPKLHRDRGVLEVRSLWWEPGIRPTPRRRRALRDELHRLAASVEATKVSMPRG